MGELEGPEGLRVEAERYGADERLLTDVGEALLTQEAVRGRLEGGRRRLLSIRLLDGDAAKERPGNLLGLRQGVWSAELSPPPSRETGTVPSELPEASNRFAATIYDYDSDRTLVAEGPLDDPTQANLYEASWQPLPSTEEIVDAVQLVLADQGLRQAVEADDVRLYRPMPPIISLPLPDGRAQRVVPVGLYTPAGDPTHRVLGANLSTGEILSPLPGFERVEDLDCGAPVGVDECEQTGSAGQVRVRVLYGGTTVWEFVVVRPAASSGTNGSGVELRYVNFRGRRVLYRAHVPILNVRYPAGGCAPSYRDWQNQEACFNADGTDVIPGFRLCPTPASTILETGADSGNFRGVAIYVQGLEVVVVSELAAGWYRYISEWRLHVDGTIRPRFGFAATSSPCTCYNHAHHAYWRFDFDIETPGNNVVQEFNDPPLLGTGALHTKRYEIRRMRNDARKRRWEISNASSGAGYRLIPGPNDGFQDSYGVGDLWVLRYRNTEIDDGQGFTTDPSLSMAHLDNFVNGELVEGQDAVVWYAGHFVHGVGPHMGGHRVGPQLEPFDW